MAHTVPLAPIRGRRATLPLAVELWAAAVLSASLGLLSGAFGSEHPIARVFLAFALVPAAALVIRAIGSGGERTVSLFCSLYLTCGLLVPGLFQAASGRFPFYNLDYPAQEVTAAAGVAATFMWTVYLAHLASGFKPVGARCRVTIRPHLAGVVVLFLAGLGLLIAIRVGPQFFLSPRGAVFSELGVTQTMHIAVARMATFTGLALSLFLLARSNGNRFAPIATAMVAALSFLFVNFPLSLPRFYMLGYAVGLVSLLYPLRTSLIKAVVAVSYPVLMITVFPAASALTRGARGQDVFINWKSYFLSSGDLDGFQSIINVYRWVALDGFRMGHQAVSTLAAFVPRSWWPEKALPTGVAAAQANGYVFTNVSAPLPAEFYADFGLIGVVLGGLATGRAIAFADHLLNGNREQGRPSLVLAISLVAGFSAILLRGSLMGVIMPCALAIALSQLVRLTERSNG